MLFVLVGIIGGIVGGMGMGSGTILIPILTLFLNVNQRGAQLMNTISFIPMALLTLIINAKAHLIKWKYILYVGVSGVLSAVGASFLVGIIEPYALRIAFGVFLVVLSSYFIILTIYKMIKKKKSETLTSINVVKDEEDDI